MGLFDLITPRITELGKIKIGGKDQNVRQSAGGGSWRAPRKLDHFIITGMGRDDKGDLQQDTELMQSLVSQGYADPDGKLRRLPIMLLSNDLEEVIQASYVWYAGRRVAARSDGIEVIWYGDPQTMKFLPEPRPPEPWDKKFLEYRTPKGAKLFKLHTIFNCVIAVPEAHWGGVYKHRTTSDISASQLLGSLMHIQKLTGGTLKGLPLEMVVRPMQVEPEGKVTTVYVTHVELIGKDLLDIRRMALEQAQKENEVSKLMHRTQIEYKKLLRAPGENEAIDESSDVAEEFHPESIDPDYDGDLPASDEVPVIQPRGRLKRSSLSEALKEKPQEEAPPDEPQQDSISDEGTTPDATPEPVADPFELFMSRMKDANGDIGKISAAVKAAQDECSASQQDEVQRIATEAIKDKGTPK